MDKSAQESRVSDSQGVSQLAVAAFSICLLAVGINSMIVSLDVVKSALVDQFYLLVNYKCEYHVNYQTVQSY